MSELLEVLAVIASAAFGVLLARSKGMDLIGVCCVAFLVAFGGGTLRDLLLDRQPLFWIANDHYAFVVFGIGVVGGLLPRVPKRFEKWLDIPDALGLGLFSIVGANLAIETTRFEVSPFLASLFGVITGTFGGVMADIVCNDVPRLFRPTVPLYASCSFVGAWVYLGLRYATVDENVALWSGVTAVVALRLVAIRFDLRLPGTDDR